MANSDKNILITPNTGQSTEPKIEFVGSSSAPITLKVLDDNSLLWEGSQGQLFSITNNLSTGSIFSVNDISGVPSIEVNADGTVVLAEFSGNVGVGTSSPTHKFEVSGTLSSSIGLFANVGIGITNPAELLDVRTTTATAGQGARIGEAKIGTWENNTDWAAFTHNSVHSTVNSYALMQNSSGRTLLNSAASQNLEFRIDNATKMIIESGGDVGIGTTNPGAKLEVDGNIKFTSAGQGIDFSADGNAAGRSSELLDDYEQGTWTPFFSPTTGMSYTTQEGHYIKIGNLVYASCRIIVSTTGTSSSATLELEGLPFASINSNVGGTVNVTALGLAINVVETTGLKKYGSTDAQLRKRTTASTSSATMRQTDLTSGSEFYISVTYITP